MIAGNKDVEVDGILLMHNQKMRDTDQQTGALYFGKDANLTYRNCVFANTGQGGVGAWNAVNEFDS